MSSRRRATGGIPRALDPVRARRASQQAAAGQLAGPGQLVDRSGRIVPNPGRAQYVDREGKSQIRFDPETLEITPGSPETLRGIAKPKDIVKAQETAEVAVESSADLDGRFTIAINNHEDRITDLETDSGATNTILSDHESRIAALEALPAGLQRESGSFKLTGTTPKEVTSALFLADLTLCSVSLTRTELGVAPGNHYLDLASSSDGTFYVVSDSILDDGKIHWSVIA